MHSQLCVGAVRTLIGRMLLDVHHHWCSRDAFHDSGIGADVDKVNCRNNCQPSHEKRLPSWQWWYRHTVLCQSEFFCDQSQKNNGKLWFPYTAEAMNLYGYGKPSNLINSDAVFMFSLFESVRDNPGQPVPEALLRIKQMLCLFVTSYCWIYFDIICCLLDMFCRYTSCTEWSDSKDAFMYLFIGELVILL